MWYQQQLLGFVKSMCGELETALKPGKTTIFDAAVNDKGVTAFNIDRFLLTLKRYQGMDIESFANRTAREFTARGDEQNAREVAENIKHQTSVDLQGFLQGNAKVAERVEQLTTANVALIKSVHSQYLDKVQNAVLQAQIKGELNADLANKIKQIGGVTESRAKLIARDQSAKVNAALTRARHEELGITHYRWSTSGDERVRDSHAELDGKIFAYDSPPEVGNPGDDFNCRCVAVPVFDLSPELRQTDNSFNSFEAKEMRSTWSDDFPDTIIDRKLGDATSHPLYEKAKAGSVEDAYNLAKDLVSDEAIAKLERLINGKDVILIPVHAEEATGRNMIPVAVATVIGKKLNIPVDLSIVQATKVSRTGSDGWHRLIYTPKFSGNVPKKLAIILDDTQTQGGTLASLKGYIEKNNGKVLGSYALTGKQYSVQLRLSKETLLKLRSEYGELESWWSKEFGYDFSKLTEWEARFILNSRKTPDEVRNTILARK